MKRKKLVILGIGGMGREVLFLLSDINAKIKQYDILGFVDNIPNVQGKIIDSYPVLGDDSWIIDYQDDLKLVVAIGNPLIRKQAVIKFAQQENIDFPNIIARNVKYSESVSMGKGNIICFSSILTVNVVLGDFVLMNPSTIIGHDTRIGNFASLYGSVHLAGNVSIGECAEIGMGAKIIQNKSIGDNAIIGAGAVVVKDIPSNCVAVGIPATPIKKNRMFEHCF
jgi:sugar O-acyltransferase (sialic acid O-acetyltransferase NeuD family)